MTVDWITGLRYDILSILQQYQCGLNQRNLSNKIGVDDSTIAKSISRLEELGFVERDQNRVYHITESGDKALQSLDALRHLSEN